MGVRERPGLANAIEIINFRIVHEMHRLALINHFISCQKQRMKTDGPLLHQIDEQVRSDNMSDGKLHAADGSTAKAFSKFKMDHHGAPSVNPLKGASNHLLNRRSSHPILTKNQGEQVTSRFFDGRDSASASSDHVGTVPASPPSSQSSTSPQHEN